MKNIKVSFFIFGVLIIYILISIHNINNITFEINELCDNIEKNVIDNQWKDAHKNAEELIEIWDQHSKLIVLYVHTGELDTISSSIVELNQHTECECKNEAIVDLYLIKYHINEIKSLEDLTIHNIF